MGSVLHVQARIGQRTLLLTTAALPFTGSAVHAVALHRHLAASKHDPLTGLLRRDAYTARARQVLRRHGDNTAVVLVDADRFKQINDTRRHPVGDVVLAAFGARLTAWAGPRAAVGRLEGDEFAVVLELPTACREQRLEQLVRVLHMPVTMDDCQALDVAVSVGAAAADVLGGRDLPALQRAADVALYEGKHSGRATLARTTHTEVSSINGRRASRPGTSVWGRAA